MKLERAAYEWAIRHLAREHDTDLFPVPVELDALHSEWNGLVEAFANLDVSTYGWRGGRRFLVPKGPLSFRMATQLDPVDSIVISALVFQYGPTLEAKRLPPEDNRAFSYRFAPDHDGRMYAQSDAWTTFWSASQSKARANGVSHVLVADISDCYNQLYHHAIERELQVAGLGDDIVKIFKRYLQALSTKASRGIPVGPHSSHVLAECTLDALDRSLVSSGLEHCRYVDDLHIFAPTYEDAIAALYQLGQTLDAQQQLVIQNAKTRVMAAADFVELAKAMQNDDPISEIEATVVHTIQQHTGGDPYATVANVHLNPDESAALSAENLESVVQSYLQEEPVDFARLGWLVRRLTQVASPGAIDVLVANLAALSPILGPIARYLMAAAPNYNGDLTLLGEKLVAALTTPIVAASPYLQAVLIDIVARFPGFNHVDSITARYNEADPAVRRAIILAAAGGKRVAWLRDRKGEYGNMDAWTRRAYVKAIAELPGDEPRFWVEAVRDTMRSLERLLAKHYIEGAKVGEIKIAVD